VVVLVIGGGGGEGACMGVVVSVGKREGWDRAVVGGGGSEWWSEVVMVSWDGGSWRWARGGQQAWVVRGGLGLGVVLRDVLSG
jgi:hypothetical protein